jgi:hypothetical protein
LPAPFWDLAPAELAVRFGLVPGMEGLERAAVLVAIVTLCGVVAGVGVRVAALVAALALYHLGPLQTVLTTTDPINRGFTIDTLCLVVLAASPCADRWAARRAAQVERDAWEYGWPLRLMWLFVAEIYLFGAIGKLRAGGLTWFTATNLRRNLAVFPHLNPTVDDGVLGWLLSQHLLLAIAAAGVLLLEGAFVAALVSRRARRLLVPGALVMHLAILRLMRGVFTNMAHLGLFVNWGWLSDRWHARRAARTT